MKISDVFFRAKVFRQKNAFFAEKLLPWRRRLIFLLKIWFNKKKMLFKCIIWCCYKIMQCLLQDFEGLASSWRTIEKMTVEKIIWLKNFFDWKNLSFWQISKAWQWGWRHQLPWLSCWGGVPFCRSPFSIFCHGTHILPVSILVNILVVVAILLFNSLS